MHAIVRWRLARPQAATWLVLPMAAKDCLDGGNDADSVNGCKGKDGLRDLKGRNRVLNCGPGKRDRS